MGPLTVNEQGEAVPRSNCGRARGWVFPLSVVSCESSIAAVISGGRCAVALVSSWPNAGRHEPATIKMANRIAANERPEFREDTTSVRMKPPANWNVSHPMVPIERDAPSVTQLALRN